MLYFLAQFFSAGVRFKPTFKSSVFHESNSSLGDTPSPMYIFG